MFGGNVASTSTQITTTYGQYLNRLDNGDYISTIEKDVVGILDGTTLATKEEISLGTSSRLITAA